jgi:hypothetical protein
MPANPNWTRWIFTSVAYALKAVATNADLAVLVEHLDERSPAFLDASDRVEIRITGPFSQEQSKGYFRLWVDVNVIIESRYDGSVKNATDILKIAGMFQNAMDQTFGIWNYGNEPGDYVDDDPSTHVFIGCLEPRSGNADSIRVLHFGQSPPPDKLKTSMVDARYVMYLDDTADA